MRPVFLRARRVAPVTQVRPTHRIIMVRPGKERAAPPAAAAAAAADADAAADDETQVTTQETRWRTGVNRQARAINNSHARQVQVRYR